LHIFSNVSQIYINLQNYLILCKYFGHIFWAKEKKMEKTTKYKEFFSNTKKERERTKDFHVVLDKEYQKKLTDIKESLNIRKDSQFLRGAIDMLYEISIQGKSPVM
jgi:hypothetical protein